MTKKGYQKRLPKVLPPPPARAEPRAAVLRAVDRPPSESDSAGGTDPTPGPDPAPAPERRSPDSLVGAVGVGVFVLGLLIGGLAVSFLAQAFQDPPVERGPATADVATSPVRLTPDESYVETRVLANGDIVVRQWIRAVEPLHRLRLVLPDVPDAGDLAATEVEVRAGDSVVAGPATLTGIGATYTFDETADVRVRYVLAGAVERSDSAEGRGLAVATTLDVRYSPQAERETRVVRASEVLSLACTSSAAASAVPCGVADSLDQWRVELTGPRVDDRVVAQVNLD